MNAPGCCIFSVSRYLDHTYCDAKRRQTQPKEKGAGSRYVCFGFLWGGKDLAAHDTSMLEGVLWLDVAPRQGMPPLGALFQP